MSKVPEGRAKKRPYIAADFSDAWSRVQRFARLFICPLLFGSVVGCTAEKLGPSDEGIGSSSGGSSLGNGSGSQGSGVSSGGLNVGPTAGTGGMMPASPVDPCVAAGCSTGQRCEVEGEEATCVDNTCQDLECEDTEECRPHAQGGNTCVNLFCEADVDCDPADYCTDNGICEADICNAGESSCTDSGVRICASNGGSEDTPFGCGSEAAFESTCQETDGTAACTCEDDWDCPPHTVCNVGHCVGTGLEATCTLPPTDFAETDPTEEVHWGNDAPGENAHDGTGAVPPWPESTEVQATPTVANLDDDNGDGLINELDIPEIVFISYTSGQVDNSGILRAIHGGGANRGKDFFAVCSSNAWQEGDELPASNCSGDGRSRSPAAIADLTEDGVPEIIQVTMNNGFRVLSNTGEILIDLPNEGAENDDGISLSPSVANLNFSGLPEIILGGSVFMLDIDEDGTLFVSRRLDIPASGTGGANGTGGNRGGPMTCIADLSPDAGQEVIAGPTLYRLPDNIVTCNDPPCDDQNLEVVWEGNSVNTGADALIANEGLCAVADIWGSDIEQRPGPSNQPDGSPEVIFIANGNVMILKGNSGELIYQEDLGGGERGGAPNVDDFDGDGFLEIATALSDFYEVIDLQEPEQANCPAWPEPLLREIQDNQADNPNTSRTPGEVSCMENTDCNPGAVCNEAANMCVCLHNGWHRESDDDSSKLTSSSVFDFNGDGAAEVIYNDECELRIFDGVTGEVHFATISRGRTWTENPIVADVDNDGNAEVVTFSNTEPGDRCDDDGQNPIGPAGIRVWGDPQDTWVPARRIWNQQSYHITNITEDGSVPVHPPVSWGSFGERTYNTYRSQPRSYGVAPDLTVSGIGIFSPNAQCGDLNDIINITYEIENGGDLRVGPGVQLSFFGIWNGMAEALMNAENTPLTARLEEGIDARRSIIESTTFDLNHQMGQSTLPDEIRVEVDTGGTDSSFGAERECSEDNNERTAPVESGMQLADLEILVGEATVQCTSHIATVAVTVENSGVVTAHDIVIQLYAGNPAQGGTALAEHVLEDPLEPGSSLSMTLEAPNFPENRNVTIWGFIDPNDEVDECNEADNTEPADNPVECPTVIVR